MPSPTANFDTFNWICHPEAGSLVRAYVAGLLKRLPTAAALARRMENETGTRFYDWVAHLSLPDEGANRSRLISVGFRHDRTAGGAKVFVHDGGVFPPVVLHGETNELAIKVESVADFLAANGLSRDIDGEPLAQVRVCCVEKENGAVFSVIERHGSMSFAPPGAAAPNAQRRLLHLGKFRMRRRDFDNDAEGFDCAERLIDAAIADLGRDPTCDLFIAAEREYWQRHNRAAQFQKARQDKLGLGWANHDHHTYRSSREMFTRLVAMWEKLGFHCRERFYAGTEAGWGAQVMEQPVTGIVTFNDVDLSPQELMGDFSHDGLAPRKSLGTVGLWCGLHGEAFLQAGMHHLAARFSFDALRIQLESQGGIRFMRPFADFPHLRQAFSEGERWSVNPKRIDGLLRAGLITAGQSDTFRSGSAIGSHLENIERNEGFKGFNQKGVSEIIAATDPRKQSRTLLAGA